LVLDTGGLIAFDRGDRNVAALVETARRRRDRVVTSSGCVAQAWRGGARQALLSRLLRGVSETGLDPRVSRTAGELCGTATTTDVVDAHVALLVRDDDVVLSSDVDDLRRLLRARGVNAQVRRC
jgi:hypothetical protein